MEKRLGSAIGGSLKQGRRWNGSGSRAIHGQIRRDGLDLNRNFLQAPKKKSRYQANFHYLDRRTYVVAVIAAFSDKPWTKTTFALLRYVGIGLLPSLACSAHGNKKKKKLETRPRQQQIILLSLSSPRLVLVLVEVQCGRQPRSKLGLQVGTSPGVAKPLGTSLPPRSSAKHTAPLGSTDVTQENATPPYIVVIPTCLLGGR